MKTLKIGRSDFELMISGNHYFVDKTGLISEFYNNESDVLLMPRPKRFGKTLNLSMIEYFFDIQKPQSKELFSEFEISRDENFCKQHQNQYPVISFTLKNIKEEDWEACVITFKSVIARLYQKNEFLLHSDKLSKKDKLFFEDVYNETVSIPKLKGSLEQLSRFLYQHFNKKVIILVDEYDTPIINAFNNTMPPIKSADKGNKTYYEKVVNFMQTFLGEAFKGNNSLEKGLITGVMRVGKESIFSDWNNVKVYGIASTYYADKFGFTQTEVEDMLNYFGLSKRLPEVEKWYNGYQFGKTDKIYNPWSIVNYIANEKDGFKAYWVNSSDYSLIQNRITEKGVKEDVEALISCKTVIKTIKDNFVFTNFENNNELLWTLLFHSGFVTHVSEDADGRYELRIPNNEVKIIFIDIIIEWIKNQYRFTEDSLKDTISALVNNDLPKFEKGLRQIMQDSISYFDTGAGDARTKEQIFQVYTLGLLAILSNDYTIKSNRESGEGRYDILIIPHDKTKYGVIIEIKSMESQKSSENNDKFAQRINNEIDNALQQIERKQYYKELISINIAPDNIVKVPIIFAGKTPYVNKL